MDGFQAEVDQLMEVAATSILATELEFLGNQQIQLPILDKFDSMNAACAQCSCADRSPDSTDVTNGLIQRRLDKA